MEGVNTMCKIPRVEELTKILNEHLEIEVVPNWGQVSPCVTYKGVPLWRTGAALGMLEIFVSDKDTDGSPYMLMCKDTYDDYYTYGSWDTQEDVRNWLQEPKAIY